MKSINEVIEIIKDELSARGEVEGRILDRHVAEALHINVSCLATMKHRNKICYLEILEFCALRKICINNILFGQVSGSLKDPLFNRYVVS